MSEKSAEELTKDHIKNVFNKITTICLCLKERSEIHDSSKLNEPELSTFNIYTEKLKGSTYGSEEYAGFLKEMKPALDHHYENNRHHPEHFKDGINEMNLVDLVEMFCDWVAATERHEDGNIYKSINHNEERFNISPQLSEIFRNTADQIFNK